MYKKGIIKKTLNIPLDPEDYDEKVISTKNKGGWRKLTDKEVKELEERQESNAPSSRYEAVPDRAGPKGYEKKSRTKHLLSKKSSNKGHTNHKVK